MTETDIAPPPEPSASTPPAPAAPARLDEAGLNLLFRHARSHARWTAAQVENETLHDLYDLLRLGPTSANCSPARFLFLKSQLARQRLLPALSPGNIDSVITAPVVCVVAHDPRFFDHLPQLWPGAEARGWFLNNEPFATETAFRNGTLQGAYLMLAARALGLDCGPMSGFDNAILDRDLLAMHGWKSNFLVALGYADKQELPERRPRLDFDLACAIL